MPGLVETKLPTSSLLTALIERRILALRMPHFLSMPETRNVSNRIHEIGIEFYVGDTKGGTSERKGKIGPNLFRFKDDLHEYFKRTFDFDENVKPVLFRDVDVVGRFASLMQSALNGGAFFQRARSDRMQACLSECTIRSLPAAPPHTDWIKAEMEDFDAVGSLTDQFAWNVYISTGESGGHTAIYNTEDRCSIQTGLAPDVLVGPKPGDLILFRTLNVHEVRQARGDRITVSGFWGPRSDGNYQYWVKIPILDPLDLRVSVLRLNGKLPMVAFMRSHRLTGVKDSPSTAMTDRARELRRSGVDIVVLSAGEPDFPTPSHAIEAARLAAIRGDTKYPPLAGARALKEAVQNKFQRDNGLHYDLEEIAIANGSKQIIFNALMSTCDPGDEVIVPVPSWISYVDMVRFAGAVPIELQCSASSGFKLAAKDVGDAITKKTKWIILNFPNNPTGAVLSRADASKLAEVLLRYEHVHVMSDDVYEHLIYDDFETATMAQIHPSLRERTLSVNSVSKTYAMTGWRVGFCGGPRHLIKGIDTVQGQSTSGVSTVGQAAAVAALNGPQEFLAHNLQTYRERRDLVVSLLSDVRGIECPSPVGAFYVFPDISACLGKTSRAGRLIQSDGDFVSALLEEQHVATVQGSAYGARSRIRISYAADLATIGEGCLRLKQFSHDLT